MLVILGTQCKHQNMWSLSIEITLCNGAKYLWRYWSGPCILRPPIQPEIEGASEMVGIYFYWKFKEKTDGANDDWS